MSSVGLVDFDIMRGQVANLRSRVETWQVPGIDGYGAQTLALGDARFGLGTVVYCVDSAAADGVIAACEAMQGTIQTVEDDFGVVYAGILIEAVDTSGGKRACIKDGNFNAIRLQIAWQMCSTQVQA